LYRGAGYESETQPGRGRTITPEGKPALRLSRRRSVLRVSCNFQSRRQPIQRFLLAIVSSKSLIIEQSAMSGRFRISEQLWSFGMLQLVSPTADGLGQLALDSGKP
jgi:hypothetical protein